MKVALIIHDRECGNWKSFQVKNGKAYLLNTEIPYVGSNSNGSIDNFIFRNVWNYAFINDGYFINPNEGFPKIDLDVIIAVAEHQNSNKVNFINTLRSKYKNSIIIATLKDTPLWKHNITNGTVNDKKIDTSFYDLCDIITLPLNDNICKGVSEVIDRDVYSLPYPYKIDELRDMFLTNTDDKSILIGCNSWVPGRGYSKCLEFSKMIAKKYNYNLIENTDSYSWKQWLQVISKTSCVINMDNWTTPGQVSIESILLDTPVIGGYSDPSLAILPEYATNDVDTLEEIFREVTLNYDNSDNLSKLKSIHSIESVKNKLEGIL